MVIHSTSMKIYQYSDLFVEEIVYQGVLYCTGDLLTIYISSFTVSLKASNTNFRQEKHAGNTEEEAPHVERTLREARKYLLLIKLQCDAVEVPDC